MNWRHRLVYRDGRMRAGIRILLYFFLFLMLIVPGQYVVAILPAAAHDWGSRLVTMATALLAGLILISRVDRRPFGALGFHPSRLGISQFGSGFALGGFLILTTAGLLIVTGSAGFAPDGGDISGYVLFLSSTLLYFGIAAAAEEILFRGYPFQVLIEWIGVWPGIVVMSGIFALAHSANPGAAELAFANIFIASVLLSLAYLRTRSLWFVTGVHLGWNWTMASALDFPVSGLVFDTPLYTAVPQGAAWWTGAGFGPEAGVAGTIMLALGIAWMLRTRRLGPDPWIQAKGPLVEDRMAKVSMP